MSSLRRSAPGEAAVAATGVRDAAGPRVGRWRSAPTRVRVGLLTLGVIGVSGAGLSALYAGTGLGVPCPLKLITGLDCPLCGGTRMGAALLHGDLHAAIVYNPIALILLVVAVVLGVDWVVELFGGPRLRLPARWSHRLAAVSSRTWWIAGFAVAIAYMLLRSLIWPIPA